LELGLSSNHDNDNDDEKSLKNAYEESFGIKASTMK